MFYFHDHHFNITHNYIKFDSDFFFRSFVLTYNVEVQNYLSSTTHTSSIRGFSFDSSYLCKTDLVIKTFFIIFCVL